MTNFTPIQLEAIKLFGRKDLSFGCVVLIKGNTNSKVNYYYICKDAYDGDCIFIETYEEWYENTILEYEKEEYEILWHIPHLEDLFRKCFENKMWIDLSEDMEWYQLIVRELKLKKESDGAWSREKYTINYEPSLPLLEQPSLPEIINLFRND